MLPIFSRFMWVYRIVTLVKKELLLLFKEKQTRLILIMPVFVQVLIFPLAATLNVTNATIGIYREDTGQASHEIIQRLTKTEAFSTILFLDSAAQVEKAINQGDILLSVNFSNDFSQRLAQQNNPQVQVILDGRHSNSSQIAANYVQQVIEQYQQDSVCQMQGQCKTNQLVIRHWFNPNLDYKWFVLPSLVALITTIGVLIVTALSIAREREQGTFEQLLVSPLTTLQIFIGKAIPALIVSTAQGTVILVIGIFVYQIAFQGSLLLYYFCILAYGLSLIGFGLLISALCSTQQQAFIGNIVFLVPAILLSGYAAPVENMPGIFQQITTINPVRHFTELTKEIYLKNVFFAIIWKSLYPLFLIVMATSSFAYFIFKKRLG